MALGMRGRRAQVLCRSKGLGSAGAQALAQDGIAVAIDPKDQERCDEAARAIAVDTGAQPVGGMADVTRPENMYAAHAAAAGALRGEIDILVNKYGGPPLGMAKGLKEADLLAPFQKMVVSIIGISSLCFPSVAA